MTAYVERVEDGGHRRRYDAATSTATDALGPPRHDRRARDTRSNGRSSFGQTVGGERRSGARHPGYSLIACVDVQPAPGSAPQTERNELLWRLAVMRMERCIRPSDQLCMLGGPRVAVCLGNGAQRVAPGALGRRLARAVGDHLAIGTTGLDLQVAIGIGIGAGAGDVDPSELAAAAMSSIRRTGGRPVTGTRRAVVPFLAITRVPDEALGSPVWRPSRDLGRDTCWHNAARQARRLGRRILVPLWEDVDVPLTASAFSPSEAIDPTVGAMGSTLRVLLVDPDSQPDHGPRPVMEAVAAVARQFGAHLVLSPAVDADAVLLDLFQYKPDVILLVLGPEGARHCTGQDPIRAWERPARIVRALREAGTPVIALSLGASPAALAVCVEQGAIGLFDTDVLPQELARHAPRLLGANGGASTNGHDEPRGPGQLPAPYHALVHLTPSERRVLFHMMEGRSAAEIATTLVVSLTTVRSHIRSILRKLNVNSQLAAVALAFGTLPDQARSE